MNATGAAHVMRGALLACVWAVVVTKEAVLRGLAGDSTLLFLLLLTCDDARMRAAFCAWSSSAADFALAFGSVATLESVFVTGFLVSRLVASSFR